MAPLSMINHAFNQILPNLRLRIPPKQYAMGQNTITFPALFNDRTMLQQNMNNLPACRGVFHRVYSDHGDHSRSKHHSLHADH
jgi:hypothetical protein